MPTTAADLDALPKGTIVHAIDPRYPLSVGVVAIRYAMYGDLAWLVTSDPTNQSSEQLVGAMNGAEFVIVNAGSAAVPKAAQTDAEPHPADQFDEEAVYARVTAKLEENHKRPGTPVTPERIAYLRDRALGH